MSNQKSYTAIVTLGGTQPRLAKTLGFRDAKTPCEAMFHNLLKRLNTVKLEQPLKNLQVLTTAPERQNA